MYFRLENHNYPHNLQININIRVFHMSFANPNSNY
jgi:hypothetical protein